MEADAALVNDGDGGAGAEAIGFENQESVLQIVPKFTQNKKTSNREGVVRTCAMVG
jgi:hypothetical protein